MAAGDMVEVFVAEGGGMPGAQKVSATGLQQEQEQESRVPEVFPDLGVALPEVAEYDTSTKGLQSLFGVLTNEVSVMEGALHRLNTEHFGFSRQHTVPKVQVIYIYIYIYNITLK